MRIEAYLSRLASTAIQEALELPEPPPAMLRRTTHPSHGDYQVNGLLPLGQRLSRAPRDLAGPVAVRLARDPAIWSAEVAGPGFLNLRIDPGWLAERLTDDLRDTERDGVPPVQQPQTIVIDFSSPNIAKQMHVGHLRSTILGDAIQRQLRFLGHRVIADNHLGDWGTQFGLLLVGMRRWGSPEVLEREPIEELERVYRLASEKAREDEEVAESARRELAKLQAGDEENVALWRRFVEASRKALERIYERLDVHFDEWLGESAYHEMLPDVVRRLEQAGLAREDQGALCIFWNELPLPQIPEKLRKQKEPFIVRKRDGAFLYSTTDIATALYRHDRFGAEVGVYVVDTRQALHFEQVFTVARLLEVPTQLVHVGFGTVLGADGKPLRTRDGGTIRLAELLDEAERRAAERMRAEGLQLPEEDLDHLARAVGIGAVKYADLRQHRLSDYRFDWDKMISFKGNAGPYLQYAHARIHSIFRKGDVDLDALRYEGRVELREEAELALAAELARFGDVCHEAAAHFEPHRLCDHIYSLARAFSSFYEACPVLKADEPTRSHRLALAALTARQLARGLDLLGIAAPERM